MMPLASVLAPLVLAAVLALSGVAKNRDKESTRSVVQLLMLPSWLQSPWVATALPVGEIVLALALLAPWTPVFMLAAVATTVLMMTYLAIVARAMGFDPRPSCGCFGRIGDQRITGRTVTRNIILTVLGLVAVAMGLRGETVFDLLRAGGAQSLWWVLGAVVTAVVAVLVGSSPAGSAPPILAQPQPAHAAHGAADSADADPEDYVRLPIPIANLVSREGRVAPLTELAARGPVLLVMTNCFCGPTSDAVGALDRWREALPQVTVEYVTTVPFSQHAKGSTAAAPADAWYDHHSAAWNALGVSASPAAVLLGADGLLAGGPISLMPEIELFVDDIADALRDGAPEQVEPAAVH